ncbi:hypothetical protein [Azotobacter armeniacus]
MEPINERDSCFEEKRKEEAGERSRCDVIFTRCLEVGMILVYGTAFLGLLF